MQVTAADVLHSFAMPSFGFKLDAVPGRLNEMWFKAEREGVYYGQCSDCAARPPLHADRDPRRSDARMRTGSRRQRRSTPLTGAPTKLADVRSTHTE